MKLVQTNQENLPLALEKDEGLLFQMMNSQ